MVIPYMDNCGNSRANTCVKPDSVEGLCLLVTEPTQSLTGLVVIHNNRTNRIVRWRYIISVSDLSAFDGRVLAYRGNDG